MTTSPTIASLHRYPVKSFLGERLERSHLSLRGLPGDRAWAVRDEVKGGIRGARRFPALMRCAARYSSEPPSEGVIAADITLPDGTTMGIDDERAPAALSELVGSEVTVWPLQPAENLEHYLRGRPAAADMMTELRTIFARTEDEPLPDLTVFSPDVLKYETPPGTYFDVFPLLLLTKQSLAHMQSLAEGCRFDVRRFRPNLLIDAPSSDPFPELAWVGKRLRIGSAVLKMEVPCPRCSITTHAVDDLPRDLTIMRRLVKEADGILGIYASIESPGDVAVGDSIEVL